MTDAGIGMTKRQATVACRRLLLFALCLPLGCATIYTHTCSPHEKESAWCRLLRRHLSLKQLAKEDPEAYCAAVGMPGTNCLDTRDSY